MDFTLAASVVTFLSGGVGAYLGSYLKKKGENLATHEDIDNLVEQVRAVTTATKEIEAKISSDVWDRQKHWELKREILFEATKRIAMVEDALFYMDVSYSHSMQSTDAEDNPSKREFMIKRQNEASAKVLEAGSNLDQARLLAELVCSKEVNSLLLHFSTFMKGVAREISAGGSDVFKNRLKELLTQQDAITAAMRKEMGIAPSLQQK